MRLSRRTSWERRPNALALAVERRRAAGAPILDLTSGNPTHAGIELEPALAQAVREALSDEAVLAYDPDPRGPTEVREAVARYHADRGTPVGADRLLLTASTSEAYASIFKTFCDPGDRVLVPEPSYPLFEFLATLEGVAIDPYPLHVDLDHGCLVDLDALASAITASTRAIVAVSPNNPTGSLLGKAELEALETLCARHDLALVVDEVFSDYPRTPRPDAVSSVTGRDGPCLTFALSGLSKVVALPQMKLGWIALQGPAALREEAAARLEIVLDTYLSVSTPAQRVAMAALPLARCFQAPIRERIGASSALLRARVAGAPLLREAPTEAGWYAVLKLPALRDEEEWMLQLLEEDGVLVQPGWFFNFPTQPWAVLSMLSLPGSVDRGLAAIAARCGD